MSDVEYSSRHYGNKQKSTDRGGQKEHRASMDHNLQNSVREQLQPSVVYDCGNFRDKKSFKILNEAQVELLRIS